MKRRHVAILNFNGDPNLGIHGFATDSYCILGKSVPEKHIKFLQEIFDVPLIKASIYGTDLIGIFCAGNSNILLIPKIIFKKELEHLKHALKELKIEICIFDTKHTALGNNLLLNDHVIFASTRFSRREIQSLKKLFGLPIKQTDLAGVPTPGSIGVITNKGGIFSTNLSEQDIEFLESILGFEIGIGTVNMGNPFISAGLVANSNGFAVGDRSSGFEISRIDESLGFVSN